MTGIVFISVLDPEQDPQGSLFFSSSRSLDPDPHFYENLCNGFGLQKAQFVILCTGALLSALYTLLLISNKFCVCNLLHCALIGGLKEMVGGARAVR